MDIEELKKRLAPGAWIARDDRKRLERELARLEGASGQAPAPCSAAPAPASPAAGGSDYGGIRIEGSDAFIRATQKALALLHRTPSWEAAQHLHCIRETDETASNAGGYVWGGVYSAMHNNWGADPHWYASTIAHEGTHASRGGVFGTEEERIAFAAQVKSLKEMNAPQSLIDDCRDYERDQHHLKWAAEGSPIHVKSGRG